MTRSRLTMARAPSSRRSRDAEALDAIIRHLKVIEDGGPSVYARLLPLLVDALGLENASAYGLEQHENTHRLTFAESTGFAPGLMRRVMGTLFAKSSSGGGLFNPLRPEPEQRNRAVVHELNDEMTESHVSARRTNARKLAVGPVLAEATHAPIFEMFRGLGVLGGWQLRVLVCEEDTLLAWVGGFRSEPVGARECRLLHALAPALERRLGLEQLLSQGPSTRRGLAAALEEISSCAYIVDDAGAVKHANAAGRARLDRLPSATRMALRAAIEGDQQEGFRATSLGGAGQRSHWLLVANTENRLEDRLAWAERRWALTARQREVVALLVRGQANKAIAIHLDCAVRTVEQHITAVLGKAGVDSRAALAAKFWKSA